MTVVEILQLRNGSATFARLRESASGGVSHLSAAQLHGFDILQQPLMLRIAGATRRDQLRAAAEEFGGREVARPAE